MPELIDVCLRSAVVYLTLLAALRLAGKRHSGQLSPHDFVLILLVSNAVQTAMVGQDTTLAGGLAAAATLIVLNVLLTRLVIHNQHLAPLLAGHPTLLIHHGQPLTPNLAHEGILIEELEAQVRAHGYESLGEVKVAIQECDGSVSVIGYHGGEQRMPGMGRRSRQGSGRGRRHRP